jgi:tetratricopeptide (TPR) repeat protein
MYLPERRGSLQVELIAAARSQQRIPYVLPPTLQALLDELNAGRPVVVLQNLGLEAVPIWHFAVVVGYSASDETFVLRSGTERRKLERAPEFGRRWVFGRQWAMVVLKPGELPSDGDAASYLKSVADVEGVNGAAGLAPAYRAALAKWPDNRIARFGLANALDADGQLAAARHEYRALLALDPNDLAALNNLADLQRRTGCRTQALATIDRALAASTPAHPLRPALERTRGEIFAMPAGDAPSCAS